jgi:hypothetical protein
MNLTRETIITAEVMEDEKMKDVVDSFDTTLELLAEAVGKMLAIKNNMMGKTIGEVEDELDGFEEIIEKIYW